MHFIEELIKTYFWKGYKYDEIISLLGKHHHVKISKRWCQRYVNGLGSFRKKLYINSVSLFKEAVRIALNVLDPEDVCRRKSHRLKRQKYRNKGPNHVWHLDSNDNLKPFGFYIHGCIDGFSRKIIWLHVANTNKEPTVIAYYFLMEIEVINGTTTKTRADLGSETTYLCGIQMFVRRNDNDEALVIEAFNTVNQPQTSV